MKPKIADDNIFLANIIILSNLTFLEREEEKLIIFHLLSWEREEEKIIPCRDTFQKIFTFRNLVSQEVTVPTWDGAESDVKDRF